MGDGALEQMEEEQILRAGEAAGWIFIYTLDGSVLELLCVKALMTPKSKNLHWLHRSPTPTLFTLSV